MAQAEIKESKGVNGEKSLTGTIYFGDDVINNIDRGWKVDFNEEKYAIIYALPNDEGKTVSVEFDAVHEFFYDFSKSVVHEEWSGSHTFDSYLGLIFKDTDYVYNLELNVPAIEKDSFGLKNRLSLFNDIIGDAGVEFTITGKIVRIVEKTGTDLSTIVQKGFDMQELKLEKNLSDFITYMKGYGAYADDEDHTKGRIEAEYKSPLADVYGILEGDPLVDERYSVIDNMIAKLKTTVEKSYEISVSLTMADLHEAGYKYESPHEGDYIMAINSDLGFKKKIRIISYVSSYDINGNLIGHEVTCDSAGVVSSSTKSNDLASKVEQALATAELAKANADVALITADGKNMMFFTESADSPEPVGKNKGDIWYKTVGDVTTKYYWTGTEWRLDPVETVVARIEKAVEQAEADTKAAVEQANEAVKTANGTADVVEKVKADVAENQKLVNTQIEDAVKKSNDLQADVDSKFAKANADTLDMQKTISDTQASAKTADDKATAALDDAAQSLIAANSKGLFKAYCDDDKTYSGFTTDDPTAPQTLAITMDGVAAEATEYDVGVISQENFLAVINGTLDEEKATNSSQYVGFCATQSTNPADYQWILSANFLDEKVKVKVEVLEESINEKVSQDTVDTLAQTVTKQETAINQNKTDIEQRAKVETTNALNSRVDKAETSIKENAEAVTVKADKSVVDKMAETVTATSAQLTVESEKIAGLVTKTDNQQTSITEVEASVKGLTVDVTTAKNRGAYIGYCNDDKTFADFTTESPATSQNLAITVDGKAEAAADYDVMTVSQSAFLAMIDGTMDEGEAGNGFKYIGFSSIPSNKPADYTWMSTTDYLREQTLTQFEVIAGQIDSVISDNSNNTQKISSLTQTVNSFNTKLTAVDSLTTKLSTLEQTTTKMQSTIAELGDTSAITSQITQLKSDVNLRVQNNKIISQINISTESILIDGKKTHITNTTTIDNAVIKDAMIQGLSATKITAGTIDAKTVNLINLNANNIVSTSFTGYTITGAIIKSPGDDGSTGVLQGANMKFYNNSNTFSMNYQGLTNVNNSYGTRTISFTAEGIAIKAGNSNSGNNRNSGIELYGDTSYIDFHDSPTDSTDWRSRIVYNHDEFPGKLNIQNQVGDVNLMTEGHVYCMAANGDGLKYIVASSFQTSSSVKYKENIVPLENGYLESLRELKFKAYNRIESPELHQMGIVIEDNPTLPFINNAESIDTYSYATFMGKALQELDSKTNVDLASIKQTLEGILMPTEIVDGKITKYKKITFLEDEVNE